MQDKISLDQQIDTVFSNFSKRRGNVRFEGVKED
jgi:hypothetical protein